MKRHYNYILHTATITSSYLGMSVKVVIHVTSHYIMYMCPLTIDAILFYDVISEMKDQYTLVEQ